MPGALTIGSCFTPVSSMLAGQSSDAKEVQAVCMVTIAKMVQAVKAAQIQAHLAQLVPALLESLSGMEVGCRCRLMHLLQMSQAYAG